MPNPHLETMIELAADDDLTEKTKTNKICIAFSAWVRAMKESNNIDTAEQLENLDIKLLEKVNTLLHTKAASQHITDMFSDVQFAEKMLAKFSDMIEKHVSGVKAVTRYQTAQEHKPLPKPPGRAATAAAATPRLFSANPATATSASVKALPLAPKPNMK